MSGVTERKILHSWKEIASYLGLGARTVQRYEGQLRAARASPCR
jgi:hypothetical protein